MRTSVVVRPFCRVCFSRPASSWSAVTGRSCVGWLSSHDCGVSSPTVPGAWARSGPRPTSMTPSSPDSWSIRALGPLRPDHRATHYPRTVNGAARGHCPDRHAYAMAISPHRTPTPGSVAFRHWKEVVGTRRDWEAASSSGRRDGSTDADHRDETATHCRLRAPDHRCGRPSRIAVVDQTRSTPRGTQAPYALVQWATRPALSRCGRSGCTRAQPCVAMPIAPGPRNNLLSAQADSACGPDGRTRTAERANGRPHRLLSWFDGRSLR